MSTSSMMLQHTSGFGLLIRLPLLLCLPRCSEPTVAKGNKPIPLNAIFNDPPAPGDTRTLIRSKRVGDDEDSDPGGSEIRSSPVLGG